MKNEVIYIQYYTASQLRFHFNK